MMAAPFHDELDALLGQTQDVMIDLRHDLHAHPELSFREFRTTSVITDRLRTLGWELPACPTETGAIGVLRGGRPGRRVMLRADIDALPVREERALPYRSLNDGVMHACGHDVHTAGLLGVADILSMRRDELAGEFTLVFQPGEEGLGGARAMIDGGVLEAHPADVVLGAHVTSLGPVGLVATRAGVLMSQASAFEVRIDGRGGHGAMASTDGNVILALSHLAPRLGEVVAGLSYEGTGCACSAGVIHAGTANNVVPRHAELRGTLRTFSPEHHVEAMDRLHALLDDVDSAFKVSSSIKVIDVAPAVTNDPGVTARVMDVARSWLGADHVVQSPPTTPSDDVSEFLDRVPGCYVFVGGALADGSSGMHHSPDFAVDDRACVTLAGVLAASAVELAQR
jgi:amidohydrolase